MAKTTGGLFALTASGSVGGAVTYSKWKGQQYVRSLVIPKNNQTEDDGDRRMIFGGIGRACKVVLATSDYEAQMIALNRIPAGQSKQSALVKFIKEAYMGDATAFEAIYTAFEAHSAKAGFTSEAVALNLYDLDIAYKGTTHTFSAGMMLYVLAKAAIDMNFTGEPYITALSSWDLSKVQAMVADFAAAA